MGFDVVSAVMERPFAQGPYRSAEIAQEWVRVASMYEGEIAERMGASARADGQHGRVPASTGHTFVGVRPSSLAARVLALLGRRVGGLTIKEITLKLGDVRVAHVRWCTTDMQARGLVERSNGAGEAVCVTMTDRGREALAACAARGGAK